VENSGSGLLAQYQGSPSNVLQTIYPENDWKMWLFDEIPHGFWGDQKNQRKFMEWLSKQLNHTKIEDWYMVTREVFLTFFSL
jgi:hypothetical protein